MHRVVVGVQAHVVVPCQTAGRPPPRRWGDRGQRQHRLPISADPLGRCAAQHPADPLVDLGQPGLELGVEVARRGERAAGQERALQVVMGPFDDALVLRLSGFSTITFVPSTPRNA